MKWFENKEKNKQRSWIVHKHWVWVCSWWTAASCDTGMDTETLGRVMTYLFENHYKIRWPPKVSFVHPKVAFWGRGGVGDWTQGLCLLGHAGWVPYNSTTASALDSSLEVPFGISVSEMLIAFLFDCWYLIQRKCILKRGLRTSLI